MLRKKLITTFCRSTKLRVGSNMINMTSKKEMSKYANYVYNEVANKYDSNRFADGVDMMTFMLSGMLKKAPAEIHILEAGCGTGNYSRGFLENGIGKVTMIDASTGMLAVAEKKVEEYSDRVVEMKQHELPSIPFPDESFDVVTFIQVLHHLDRSGCPGDKDVNIKERYKNLYTTIREAYRVLKPTGILLIDTCFDINLEAHCQWIASAPKAFALCKEVYIPDDYLINLLKDEKFQNLLYVTRPGSTFMKSGISHEPELILNKEWRDTDSMWSFTDRTGELPAILEEINKANEEGRLPELVKEKTRLLHIFGATTILFGQKEPHS